jgi:hypothetical protein
LEKGCDQLLRGGQFSVKASGKKLIVGFENQEDSICDVNTHVIVVGDLKFYAQILGGENMSSYWCMRCDAHPNTWANLDASSNFDLWTIEHIQVHRNKVIGEGLKDAKDACRVVDFPLWDFIQPLHYVFPQLHVEIGLENIVLESF